DLLNMSPSSNSRFPKIPGLSSTLSRSQSSVWGRLARHPTPNRTRKRRDHGSGGTQRNPFCDHSTNRQTTRRSGKVCLADSNGQGLLLEAKTSRGPPEQIT